MVDFLKQDGTPTTEGAAVLGYIHEQIKAADDPNDKTKMNALSGPIRHFWVNVVAGKTMTESAYLRDYPYAVGAVWSIVEAERAEKAQEAAQQESQNAFAEEFKKLREQVEAQAKELATLKEAKKPAKKPAKTEDGEDSAESEA